MVTWRAELAARVKLPMRTLMDRRGTAQGRAAQPLNSTRLRPTRGRNGGRKPASCATSPLPSNVEVSGLPQPKGD